MSFRRIEKLVILLSKLKLITLNVDVNTLNLQTDPYTIVVFVNNCLHKIDAINYASYNISRHK